MQINAYAAMKSGDALTPFTYETQGLAPDQVLIGITHCGICHSDIHLIDDDWKTGAYPLIPGHEIVGTVIEVGNQVKHLKKGERAGVGWQCDSCGYCEWCMQGEENLCSKQQATCVGRPGGYANAICVPAHFAFPIPTALSSAQAAPLLCGGATVYSPLRRFINNPAMRVGVMGIGGLGHLALQFSHAFGCETTAFSTSKNKEPDARKLGADHFIVSNDNAVLKKHQASFDFILATTPKGVDWSAYIALLRPKGVLCIVGALETNITASIMSLVDGRKSICGSNIAGTQTIKEMLEFAARHHIGAQVETVPLTQVNEAVNRVREGKSPYRLVLEVSQ